jgi:hypothetical protein
VIVLDTSGLLAAIDASQRDHRPAADAPRAAGPPRLLSPFVLAELDDLLASLTRPSWSWLPGTARMICSRSTSGISVLSLRSMADRSGSCRRTFTPPRRGLGSSEVAG